MTGPAPRTFASMAESSGGGDVLIGGSVDGTTNGVADTWSYDGAGHWSQASPATSPSARIGAAMAYDPDLGETILFGGYSGGATVNDTWAWDGSTWHELTPTQAPPARALSAMVYDAQHHELVLFGGSALTSGSAAADLLDDTWTFNGDWQRQMPALSPPARDWHAMAYDAATARAILYGGYDGAALGDTWGWDGAAWTSITPAHSPGPLYQHGMVYLPHIGAGSVVSFGGVGASNTVSGQTWSFDGTDWSQVSTATAPAARTLAAMAYSPVADAAVTFGGEDGTQPGAHLLGDTWQTQLAVPVMSVTPLSVDFGKVNELEAAYATVSVSNSGSGTLQVARLLIGGADPQPFSVTSDGCTGTGLASGQTCQVTLRYQYTSTQSCYDPCSAALFVVDASGSGVGVPLTAIETFALITRSASSLDFGNVPVGHSATLHDVITNGGTGDALISRIYSTSSDFAVASDCPIAPAALGSGASCGIDVSFIPSALGSEAALVYILDNEPPGYDFIGVGGTGVAAALTVTVADATREYGQPNPGFTIVATGLVGGDTVQSLGTPTFSTSAVASGPVGDYAVTASGLSNPRYVISYVAGTLHVVPASVDIGAIATSPAAPQFDDAVTLSASPRTSSGATPTGTVTFTINGHSLAPVAVGAGQPAAVASVRLDPAVIPGGAGSYAIAASFSPTDPDFAAASGATTVTVVPKAVTLTYTGAFVVNEGGTPNLSVTVTQSGGAGSFVDFAAIPVSLRFDVTGTGAAQTLYASVADAPSWSSTGGGTAAAVPGSLADGAYTVAVHLVPGPYVAGPGARVGVTVSPINGSYTAGAGTLAADPAGAFAFVGASRAGELSGSAMYSYRTAVGGHDDDVWMSSTSVTAFGPAGKGAAQVAGACTLTFVDATTGAVDGTPVACSYSLTDSEATGSSPAEYAITITGADGSVLHSATGTPSAGTVRVHL